MKDSLHQTLGRCVHQVFENRAEEEPDRTAVAMGSRLMSYGQLNEQANLLAQQLGESGIGPGARVGIGLDRSPELIVAILGTLKSGAAYVPLDPGYPGERLEFMRADAELSAVIDDQSLLPRRPANAVPTLRAAEGRIAGNSELGALNRAHGGVDSLAYVMYTSGSTGRPKGVAVPHRGITRLVCSPDYVDIGADDVFLQMAPISFDASTFEIWGALLNGARLVLMPPGPSSLGEIAEVILRESVTILWLTGGLFNLMVDERLDGLSPVKQLLIGGEALSVPHVEKALAALDTTLLINGYGPTENTTFTCCHRIRRGETFPRGVPIGRPIRGTNVRVVDAQMRDVAPGLEGELLAGGDGLALGYWNQPELTADRFIYDPAEPTEGARFYRTGDHVRVREDGNIEFLGRRDGQVKLRGFRIEMGEIEAAVRTHEGVRDCAAKVVTDGTGQGYVVAYVVRNASSLTGTKELSECVAGRLPDHMWPATWVFLDQLPLSPNGKVDRTALPDPQSPFGEPAKEQPISELECIISKTWQGVLGRRDVGLSVSFFDAGGNSLQVTRLAERLGREHGIVVPLTDLFQFPSVRRLAKHLAALLKPSASPSATGQNPRGATQRQALHRFQKLQVARNR